LSYTAPHAGNVGSDGEHGEPVPRISKGPYAQMQSKWGLEVEYASAVTEIDRQLGLVLQALNEADLADNTVVIFASDNGASNEGGHNYQFFESSGPLQGFKRSLHEGGHRTAFIVRWPGVVKPASRTTQQVAFYDLMATAADIAGLDPVADLPAGQRDGMSIAPMLRGTYSLLPREFVYHEYCAPTENKGGWGQAVRKGSWAAVCIGAKPKQASDVPVCSTPLLYNLSSDLSQAHDVAAAHPDVATEMLAIMKREHVPGDYCGKALDGRILADPVNFEDEADFEAFASAPHEDRFMI